MLFGAVAAARAWFAPTSQSALRAANPTEVTIPHASEIPLNQQRVEAELITIRATGFEPAEITRATGPFILAVDNRSGLEEIELQLNHETGRRERNTRVNRKQLDWRDLVDLPPGRYVLKEINHPDWTCRITILQN